MDRRNPNGAHISIHSERKDKAMTHPDFAEIIAALESIATCEGPDIPDADFQRRVRYDLQEIACNAIPKLRALAEAWEAKDTRIAELEKALEPFAKACKNNIDCDADKWRDSDHLWESSAAMDITAGDLRVAKAAICGGGGQK